MTTVLDELRDLIVRNGGTLVGMSKRPIQFAVKATDADALCALLQQAGWTPHPRGTTTRTGPDGFFPALLFDLHRRRMLK